MFRIPALITAVALVAACGTTTTFTPTNTPPRPMQSRSPDSVEVFTSSVPERPFVEIGMIEAQQSSELSVDDASAVIASLRAEAAKRGCDAVVVNGANDSVVGQTTEGEGYTTTLKGYRGTCVMYKAAY